jgi:hypothetical protein
VIFTLRFQFPPRHHRCCQNVLSIHQAIYPHRQININSPNKTPLRRQSIFSCCQKKKAGSKISRKSISQIFSETTRFPIFGSPRNCRIRHSPTSRTSATHATRVVVQPSLASPSDAKLTIDVLTTVRLCKSPNSTTHSCVLGRALFVVAKGKYPDRSLTCRLFEVLHECVS